MMEHGIDIWGYGDAQGVTHAQWVKVIHALDASRLVVQVGYDCKGVLGKLTEVPIDEDRGRPLHDFVSYEMSRRSMDLELVECKQRTVGQLVREASQKGFAMIAVVLGSKLPKHLHQYGVTRMPHMVGFSPKMGFYDIAKGNAEGKALFDRGDQNWKIVSYKHGKYVPGAGRRAALWIMFKGE